MVTERRFLPTVRAAMRLGGRVEHLVVIDGREQGAIGLDEFAEGAPAGFDLSAVVSAVEPDDVATLIYTSGTTGPPKGVELTHANLIAQWNMLVRVWPIRPGGRVISYLPSAHIADRTVGLYLTNNLGYTVTCCPDPAQLGAALAECRPTFFVGVPRIWEKLKASIEAQVASAPDKVRAAFQEAFAAGLHRVRVEQAGSMLDPQAIRRAQPDDERVFAPIRAKLGLDQAEVLMVGAAPTPMQVHEFFAAIGLMLAEGWAMSELSPIATLNPPGRIKLGSCGPALPGVDVRLGEDGEVLVAGPTLMRGYRNQPEKTAEAIDEQGYLHSGDIGRLDQDGYLTIVDRKKELIINSAGKNMSPANIESQLKTSSPLIAQAACIGDARRFNVALLVLDPDAVPAFAGAHGLDASDLAAFVREPEVLAEIEAAVARANATLSRVEQIKRWTLLPTEWPPAGDELTPTMKLRRRSISAKYAAEIEALYAG